MVQEIEKIKFRVGLSGQYWDKKPEYSVAINGKEYLRGFITAEPGDTETFEFVADISEGTHRLEIALLNKENSDVVKNTDSSLEFTIVKDMLLNIDSIEIDDIDIGHLRYTKSKYELVKKQIFNGAIVSELESCVNLGFNGTYVMQFESPFYLWLLENL
jgi:hypothetical protein